MGLSAFEIIALILVIVFVIKMIVLFIKPKAWIKFVEKLYINKNAFTAIILILAAFVLSYLIRELSIVDIFAVTVFVCLLIAAGFAQYKDDLFEFAHKIMRRKKAIKKSWLIIVIWFVLSAWVIWQVFF
jgi:hypothetical protein